MSSDREEKPFVCGLGCAAGLVLGANWVVRVVPGPCSLQTGGGGVEGRGARRPPRARLDRPLPLPCRRVWFAVPP